MELKYRAQFLRKLKTSFALSISMILMVLSGCKKLVEVSAPDTSINSANVYNTDATAAAVLTGMYTNMSSSAFPNGGLISMSLFPGLSADELSVFGNTNTTYINYYTNALTNTNTGGSDFWINIYQTLYTANAAIEGLNSAVGLTPSIKQQLLGEASFMRAFCYFYLVNLYGDVPLVTTTNYKVNALLHRTPKAQVWQQIIADLKNAQGLLSANYLDATLLNVTTERVRPTKWAATALLARAYLYLASNSANDATDYSNAYTEATSLINNSSQYSLDTLNGVFLKNSNEAIWQLQPVNIGQNTQDALLFILPASGPGSSFPVYLNPVLVNAFEQGDQRKTKWVNSVTDTISGVPTTYYYSYKYKVNIVGSPVTEYEMVMRLGEQYLIRAEAEANGAGNGFSAAIADLNIIRNRAGLPNSTATPATLLTAILHERQVELFTEWGHRWLDLKRTGTADAIMSVVTQQKGGVWNASKQLYPIPLYELQHDPNLLQNQGY